MPSCCQLQRILIYCVFTFLVSSSLTAAEPLPEGSLSIDGNISEDGTRIELNWAKSSGSAVGRVSIQRRILGETYKESWQSIASLRSFARVYVDEDVEPDIAYEYRISRPSKEKIETGYWTTGRNLPAHENQGVAIVIVDETLAEGLGAHLDRFMLDLIGDGWQVIRHDAPRGDDNKKNAAANLKSARRIRAWIKRHYYSEPSTPHALILIGHIPIVKSGHSRPDGHKARPLETDLFYADVNGIWTDNGKGILRHSAIPSDHIEMQVGRIDFSNLDGALGDEISLLKRYLDKNHHWRHGRLGDLRQAYGGNNHLTVETNGLSNIVGPKEVVKGGHHNVGKQQPWLFGVDFGSHKYMDYTTGDSIKAIFSINFGSGKLDYSRKNNTMKAMLAQQFYGLATGWGARPAWQLHHMALGKSIGYSHLRTVNNGTATFGGVETLEYTPTGDYTWLNPIWVNLLGDPTLHPFPLKPARNLRAEMLEGNLQLTWTKADSEPEVQYRVYRALDRFGPYQALNPSKLHTGDRYVDPNPASGAWYMVRAHSLKNVYAGSLFTFSQGAFATIGNVLPKATDQSISTPMNQAVKINLSGSTHDTDGELITAFIKDSEGGHLIQSNGDWSFVPDAGFTGRVDIPFSVFDGAASDEGLISIDVLAP